MTLEDPLLLIGHGLDEEEEEEERGEDDVDEGEGMVGPAHPGEISGGDEEEEENVLPGRGRGTVSGKVSP